MNEVWLQPGQTKLKPFYIKKDKKPYPIIQALRNLNAKIALVDNSIVIKNTINVPRDRSNEELLKILDCYEEENGEKIYIQSKPDSTYNFEPKSMVINYKLKEKHDFEKGDKEPYIFLKDESDYLKIDGYKRLEKLYDNNFSEIDWLIDKKFILKEEDIKEMNKQMYQDYLNKKEEIKEMNKQQEPQITISSNIKSVPYSFPYYYYSSGMSYSN